MAKAFLAIVAAAVLLVPRVGAARRDPNPGRLAVSVTVTRWCPPHLADQRISDNTILKTARTTMACRAPMAYLALRVRRFPAGPALRM
jgi:hypothetical protein